MLRVRYVERFVQKSFVVIVITFLALVVLWVDESDKVHQYNESWIQSRIESKQQLALLGAEATAFAAVDSVQLMGAARRSLSPLCPLTNEAPNCHPSAIHQSPYSHLFEKVKWQKTQSVRFS